MQPEGEHACLRTPRCNSTQYEISTRIAVLNELPAQQLRDEWRRLHRGQPPRLGDLQELGYGGLSKATQRRLAAK
jgi:hypothetical protein